jgi:two-component system sensor histidine kinase BarA
MSSKQQSLVRRLTKTFVMWIAIAYVVSLAGLWWSAHYVVENNLQKELLRLTAEFDELGTPLFFADGSPALERVRKYAAKHTDVLFVRYYHAANNKVLGEYVKDDRRPPDPSSALPATVHSADFTQPIVLVTHNFGIVGSMRALAPIRTHSLKDDQMLDMDMASGKQVEQARTIGYLEVGADIAPSRAVIINAVMIVAWASTLLLLPALIFGRRHVRDALSSLLALQDPLKQVAAGNFNVSVAHNDADREIATVCEAVNATVAALRVREAEKDAALRAKGEAESASEAKSLFLAHMSHEIRTPLNGIMGFLKLLSKTPLSTTQNEYLHTTEVSAKTLLTVINDILDFSKIEAGKISMEQLDIEFRELLEEAMSLHAANAEEKGLDLVLVYQRDVPHRLMGDPARISQILSNLVGNAIKFTQSGEVLVTVELKEETAKDVLVEIAVKDSGIGISSEGQSRLFQAFSQADASTTRKFGGTGLGLIISKRLAELMGGRITVDSEAGKGARFAVTLRLVKQVPAIVPVPLADLLAAQRILSVTPNAMVARSLTENFAAWGMQSDSAASGQAALRQLERAANEGQDYGAIVFDQAVKDMAPEYFAMRLKNAGMGDTPLLLLGGLAAGTRQEEARSRGYAGVIGKPAKSSELYNELTRLFVGGRDIVAERELAPGAARLTKDGRRARVLIVDDNEINRKLAKILVDQLEGQSDLAEDGAQAVEACRFTNYDLVLMDVHMPVMDGIEATTRIRELEKDKRHTLIVALTANAMSGDRERYLAAGMDDYLGKPINEKAFINTLSKHGLVAEAPAMPAPTPQTPAPSAVNTESEAAAEAQPILDPKLGQSLAFGDRATWRSLLDMLFKQLPEDVAKLTAQKTAGNAEGVRDIAHKIAGASAYCGTPCLTAEAKRVENLVKAGDADAALRGVDELIRQIDRVLAVQKNGRIPDDDQPVY